MHAEPRDAFGKRERRLMRLPALVAPPAVQRDALGHLRVERLRRRHIAPGRRQRRDQRLGVPALAGARAAEDEGERRERGHLPTVICQEGAKVESDARQMS